MVMKNTTKGIQVLKFIVNDKDSYLVGFIRLSSLLGYQNSFHFPNTKTELEQNMEQRAEGSRQLNIKDDATIFIKAGAETTHDGRHSSPSPAFVAKTVIVITARNAIFNFMVCYRTNLQNYVVSVLFNCVLRIS